MEAEGFNINEFQQKPMLNSDIAFKGAFLMHHRNAKVELIDEIFNNMKNKTKLISKLMKMIDNCYATLLDENSNDEGNIEWDTTELK